MNFGVLKSPVNPKDPPNISSPKMLTNVYKPRAYIRDFVDFAKIEQSR